MATIRDEEIIHEWNTARKLYHGGRRPPTKLGKLMADQIINKLEKAGVTEEDIDRLFPEDTKYRREQEQWRALMEKEYGPYLEHM